MIWSVKKLNKNEHNICLATISSKAIFAIVGDAIKRRDSISVIRMGDGEFGILNTTKNGPFNAFEKKISGVE